jgi:hypothetical protein
MHGEKEGNREKEKRTKKQIKTIIQKEEMKKMNNKRNAEGSMQTRERKNFMTSVHTHSHTHTNENGVTNSKA